MVWLRADPQGGTCLTVYVQPGASANRIAGLHGDALKIKVAAPAVEGAANAALVAFLAQTLNLSRREVTIAQGEKSRRKTVRVDLDPAEVARRIGECA